MADDYKNFKVRVTHGTTRSADVTIKAKSKDEAEERALSLARNNDSLVKWEEDDGNNIDPYIPDSAATEDLGSVTGKCKKCGTKVKSKKFREHLLDEHKAKVSGFDWEQIIELFNCED